MDENLPEKSTGATVFHFQALSSGLGLGRLLPHSGKEKGSSAPNHSLPRKMSAESSAFEREKKTAFERRFVLPWRFRLLAHGIDILISTVCCVVIFLALSSLTHEHLGLWITEQKISRLMLLIYGIYFLYLVGFKFIFGQTLGFLLIRNRKKSLF